jgi:hypothetical protein
LYGKPVNHLLLLLFLLHLFLLIPGCSHKGLTKDALLSFMRNALADGRRGKFMASDKQFGLTLSSEEVDFNGEMLTAS